MKRFLIFLLLIAMLCMVGCGKDSDDKNSDTTPVGGVTQSTKAPTEEPTEAPTEDPHAGWIWLLGDVYIPELPFTDWEGQNQDNIRCYTVFIKSNNSAAFHTYAQSLTDFGYNIEQNESFSYKGTDPEGRSIHLTDHENGRMEISVYY